ncbi:nucleotide exchange factor GrpE [Christensenellaceae bacterium OttesenSCG-928-M15]|nr:nucleotide exchange factor GrpE [Christensenellaceae bacterium OttesenSCG-928-M15]
MDNKKPKVKAKEQKEEQVIEVGRETAADEGTEAVQAQAADAVQLTKEEFEKVKAHIETLQKEKDEAVNMAQRLQAEFDNYRKRNSALRTDSLDEGKCDCIKAILPTLDNFDRALLNTEGVDQAFVDGVSLIYKNLLETLEKMGLKEVDAAGEFDANLHNAVMREAVEGKKSGDILEVFQKGYEVNGKILRYSMVKVAE